MDQKTWLWRKKSSEKTIIAADNTDLTSKENEEVQALVADKDELEKDLKRLNNKLDSALSDCNAKNELVKKQTKVAQEAMAGLKKAEAEVLSMKQDLDEALHQRIVYEERVAHLDGALKECMQQLRFVREEQEQRIHDAVMKASKEFEKERMVLEEQLSETSKRLAKAEVDNSHLNKSIFARENLIQDLRRQLTQAEEDHGALMSRLESMEKDNTSLTYEVRVLEKELEIRNEEREFSRRTAEASHKQQLESTKKIAKLELECQRLRLLVRKRLPGPAALAKMKNEVEMLGRDSFEIRRSKLSTNNLLVESSVDNSPETPITKINTLTEQLCALEEENKVLKESLNRKMNELQFSRVMLTRTASKLLHLESQIEDLHKGHLSVEHHRSNVASHEFSFASLSDAGSDDKASCAESWASALISELDHFRSEKKKEPLSCKSVGASDINLMDDFVEMEKLAVVSVEKATQSPSASLKAVTEINSISETGTKESTPGEGKEIIPVPDHILSQTTETTPEVVGMEIIPMSDHISDLSKSNKNTCSIDIFKGTVPGWLQDVVKTILEQNHVTHKGPDDILHDIRVALRHVNDFDLCDFDSSRGSVHIDTQNPPQCIHCISCSDSSLVVNPSAGENIADILSIKRIEPLSQEDLSKSIGKVIEIVERILPAVEYDSSDPLQKGGRDIFSYKNLGMPTGYMVRVFQWKTSELSKVIEEFLHVCYDLLSGKADYGNFAKGLTTALDWIINHCFSLQDVSSMRDAIKKQFDWDETRSEGEIENELTIHLAEKEKLQLPRENLSSLPQITTSCGHDLQNGEIYYNEKEFTDIKDKLISAESQKEVLEGKLQSATDRIESLVNQIQESEKTIDSLRLEIQSFKESNGQLENEIKNQKLINSNLDAQHTEAELKAARNKIFSLELELENKNSNCEELEAKCLELQLQLESMSKQCSKHDIIDKDKPLRNDWEITAASEKLAECQETILNLGKQLKAMAAPKDASLFDSVVATQFNTVTNNTATTISTTANVDPSPTHPKVIKVKTRSLLDQMLADDSKAQIPKASDGNSNLIIPGVIEPLEKILVLNGVKGHEDRSTDNSLAIVPAKKPGSGSLWRKLLRRKKRSASMKTSFS
ncbi:filament-like plant protein 7 [Vigna radiata var. radiata]|uniref:Filament-like plant protein 7 n=1 Tax=Vigna radiata var. radiata TaxID=3916 RepID=A0A1S3UT40_VIGRR|nr:filament-like plant protein 7 [Vigna radiata var. radiata]XP_014509143.1 filament-like plant protein 7 [Vigna radiata var. radiata]